MSSSKKIYFQTSTSRGDQKSKGIPSIQIKKVDKGISGRTQHFKDGANSVLSVKESNKALSAMTKTAKPSNYSAANSRMTSIKGPSKHNAGNSVMSN